MLGHRRDHRPRAAAAAGPADRRRRQYPIPVALLDYREDLIDERSALANRAHAELGGLHPGYQHPSPI
jgi:transposase